MPDPRFYRRAGPFRLGDLAGCCGAALAPGADAALLVHDVAALDVAGPRDITFLADPSYVVTFAAGRSGACVTTKDFAARGPAGCAVLIAKNPRDAFADIAAHFYPTAEPTTAPRSGYVAPDAKVGEGTVISPGAVIGAGAEIGARTYIGANAVIGEGVVIGGACRIGANSTIAYCLIGDGVTIHPGVQIGQDGFGFVSTAAGHKKVPQLGRVVIHEDVEIGANSAIDRGTSGDTVIGAGTKIDNLVQIGHNVEIGRRCIIVSQVGISGSCKIGDGAVIGGQVGLADHVQVGAGAQVAAKSGVMRDVPPGEVVMGYPAKPIRQFWREIAALTRLTKRDKAP